MSGNKPDPVKDKEFSNIGGNVNLVSKSHSIGPGEGKDGPTIEGIKPETVGDGLKILENLGVKDDVERGIIKIDYDSKEEMAQESALITARINELDIFITIGLYYTSLIMDWLTQLGDSYSVEDFFITLFFKSFQINEWHFGALNLVGKISGATTTLQTFIFVMVGLIRFGCTSLGKKVPKSFGGPMYFGGPFQIIHVFLPTSYNYHESIQSLDAIVSQSFGAISQLLIIIAAFYAIGSRNEALDPFASGNETAIGSGYQPGSDTEDQYGNQIQSENSTDITFAVQNAAVFSRATYIVSACAIIMTSLLNIIQWMADVWRLNKNELIVYTAFKLLTRILLCYPCFGDNWLKKRSAKNKEKNITGDQDLLLEEKVQDPGGSDGDGGSSSSKVVRIKNDDEQKVIIEKDEEEDKKELSEKV